MTVLSCHALRYDPESGQVFRNGKPIGYPTSNGYLRARVNKGPHVLLHRLAWFLYYGYWPTKWIDHINRDKTDNRIANLREVDGRGNNLNRPRKYLYGVHKNGKRFTYEIVHEGKRYRGQCFDTELEAHEAYRIKAKELGIDCSFLSCAESY